MVRPRFEIAATMRNSGDGDAAKPTSIHSKACLCMQRTPILVPHARRERERESLADRPTTSILHCYVLSAVQYKQAGLSSTRSSAASFHRRLCNTDGITLRWPRTVTSLIRKFGSALRPMGGSSTIRECKYRIRFYRRPGRDSEDLSDKQRAYRSLTLLDEGEGK